jgi:hypothetical protein
VSGLEVDPAKQLINIVLTVFAGMDPERFISSHVGAEARNIQAIPSRLVHRCGRSQISAIGYGNKREQRKRNENAINVGPSSHFL